MDLSAAAVSLTELRKDARPVQNNVWLIPAPGSNVNTVTSDIKTTSTPEKTSSSNTNATTAISNDKKSKQQSGSVLNPSPFFYYCDRSDEIDDDPLTPLTPPGRVPNFPATMYAILCDPALKDVIAWMPHGRSWRILNPRELEIRVLPKYFEHNKFSSFIRQTNGWGFRRLTKGLDRHSYYNENFLRGLPHLCKKMKRVGSASKVTLDPNYEPDLYEINKLHPLPTSINSFIDESINFQVSRGPRTRMPVTYGAFDATKPTTRAGVINQTNIERLFKRPSTESSDTNDVKHKQLKLVTSQTTETDKTDMLQQSSTTDSARQILSTSLREISSMHLEAALMTQMLSELYKSNIVPSMQPMTSNDNRSSNSTSSVHNFNQLHDIYQPVVNPLSPNNNNTTTTDSAKLQECLRNILQKNKASPHP